MPVNYGKIKTIIDCIMLERERQEEKHGDNPGEPYTVDRYAMILMEEVGEFCKAVVEYGYYVDKLASPNRENIYPLQTGSQIARCRNDKACEMKRELIQVATTAIAILEKLKLADIMKGIDD